LAGFFFGWAGKEASIPAAKTAQAALACVEQEAW
jgi:hypothetical protein